MNGTQPFNVPVNCGQIYPVTAFCLELRGDSSETEPCCDDRVGTKITAASTIGKNTVTRPLGQPFATSPVTPRLSQYGRGYYLLYEIGGIDGIYYVPHISQVGLYSARYRLLSAWPLKELLTGIGSLDEAVQWLSRRLGMDGPEPTQPQRPSRNVRKRRTH